VTFGQVYCAAREYDGSVEQQVIRVTDPPGGSNRTLFTGTAWHYARYRPGYPSMFFTDLVARFHLDGTGRLLDLGCGTGQLTLRLAEHVAAAIGIDPEPEMLTEARGRGHPRLHRPRC
jgi:SAM-dependent methyltransferase